MKFLKGICCLLAFTLFELVLQLIMTINGVGMESVSADAQYLADAIIMAGVLASDKD